MDDFDDIEDVAEDVGDEVEDAIDRRGVLAGILTVVGGGVGFYYLTQGDGSDAEKSESASSSGDSLSGDVTGTPASGYIESFEDGSLAAYDTANSGVAVDSRQSHHGDGALHLRTSDGSVQAATTELDSLPGVGDTFRYRFYPTPVESDGGANVVFGLGENGVGYQIICNFWKGYFGLKRKDAESRTTLGRTAVDWTGDQWYTVEVQWGQDEIAMTLGDESGATLAEVTGSDDTYSSGGLALTAWANTYQLNVFYDAIERV